MKQRPILMSTPMVQALVRGEKSQTRRTKGLDLINENPADGWAFEHLFVNNKNELFAQFHNRELEIIQVKCPYGKIGDVLWVKDKYYAYGIWLKNGHSKQGKQMWRFIDTTLDFGYKFHYCENPPEHILPNTEREACGWFKRSSLFMPYVACRIKLEITDMRVERLNDISVEDCMAESIKEFTKDGVGFKYGLNGWFWNCENGHPSMCYNPKLAYEELWESINGKGSWAFNPYLWVIEFKQIEQEEQK